MIYGVNLDGVSIYGLGGDMELLECTCSQELNGAGNCSIKMPYNHQSYDTPQVLKSIIDILENNDIIWTGRITNINKNWRNEKTIEAEGAFAYFNDSIQRPYTWQNAYLLTVLQEVIARHNDQMPNNMQVEIRNVTVNNVLVTKAVDYTKTFDVIQDQFLGVHGGYMFINKEKDQFDQYKLYLDWYEEVPYNGDQPVQFGVN